MVGSVEVSPGIFREEYITTVDNLPVLVELETDLDWLIMPYSKAFQLATDFKVEEEFLLEYGSALQWGRVPIDVGEFFKWVEYIYNCY